MSTQGENTLKILVATDIHLGYNEKDPIRGEDTFITFEEILKHAKLAEVDFVLLGGDLFHETRPSTTCLHRCMTLLRRYCLGDRPVEIEFLSDQSCNFQHLSNPQVNYEDANLNISMPVFSIHGNHDDPTGAARLSVMDLLADTGLVNYFGKWTDLTQIDIHPLLIRKGTTKLALYGLSHIKDERLSRLFADIKVKMPKPIGDYFNLLVLHQNRADRGYKNYIPEDVLPPFLDLVIWGHEHDCRIDPEESKNGVYISQPGSSVATSLAHGESLPKHVGLLYVRGKQYKIEKILLKTVRPFVFKEVNMDKERPGDMSVKEKVIKLVKEMIEEAKEQIHTDVDVKQPKLPLIRLVVQYNDSNLKFNAIRMGQQFIDQIANPIDAIVLKTKKQRQIGSREERPDDVSDISCEGVFTDQVEGLLKKYFEDDKKSMTVLSLKAMSEAATRFLDRNDENAFEDVINYQCERTGKKMMDLEFDDNTIDECLKQVMVDRVRRTNEDTKEIISVLDNPNRLVTRTTYDADTIDILSEDDEPSTAFANSMRDSSNLSTRRPVRGRGSRGPRRPRRARASVTDM